MQIPKLSPQSEKLDGDPHLFSARHFFLLLSWARATSNRHLSRDTWERLRTHRFMEGWWPSYNLCVTLSLSSGQSKVVPRVF